MRRLPYEERLQRLDHQHFQQRRPWVELITAFNIFKDLLDYHPNLFLSPTRCSLKGYPKKYSKVLATAKVEGRPSLWRLWNNGICSRRPSLQLVQCLNTHLSNHLPPTQQKSTQQKSPLLNVMKTPLSSMRCLQACYGLRFNIIHHIS